MTSALMPSSGQTNSQGRVSEWQKKEKHVSKVALLAHECKMKALIKRLGPADNSEPARELMQVHVLGKVWLAGAWDMERPALPQVHTPSGQQPGTQLPEEGLALVCGKTLGRQTTPVIFYLGPHLHLISHLSSWLSCHCRGFWKMMKIWKKGMKKRIWKRTFPSGRTGPEAE